MPLLKGRKDERASIYIHLLLAEIGSIGMYVVIEALIMIWSIPPQTTPPPTKS
jgi:hypothetical protein